MSLLRPKFDHRQLVFWSGGWYAAERHGGTFAARCREAIQQILYEEDEGGSMKVKTRLKSGKLTLNHNETLVRDRAKGFKVKTRLKSGKLTLNHNETLVRDAVN